MFVMVTIITIAVYVKSVRLLARLVKGGFVFLDNLFVYTCKLPAQTHSDLRAVASTGTSPSTGTDGPPYYHLRVSPRLPT